MDCSPPGSSVYGTCKTRILQYSCIGKCTPVNCHSLLQGIFLIQGSNPALIEPPALQADSLPSEAPGSSFLHEGVAKSEQARNPRSGVVGMTATPWGRSPSGRCHLAQWGSLPPWSKAARAGAAVVALPWSLEKPSWTPGRRCVKWPYFPWRARRKSFQLTWTLVTFSG